MIFYSSIDFLCGWIFALVQTNTVSFLTEITNSELGYDKLMFVLQKSGPWFSYYSCLEKNQLVAN